MRSTSPVSTSQIHTHRFQPAVTNFTTLFLAVARQTLPSHTHTPICLMFGKQWPPWTKRIQTKRIPEFEKGKLLPNLVGDLALGQGG